MTSPSLPLPPPPPGIPEHRGADGLPAEGRRFYDRESVRMEDALLEMGGAFRRTRTWIVLAVLAWTIITGALTWFGWQGTGPGGRIELLSRKADTNFTELANRDSTIATRLDRLERIVSTMAYRSCMADKSSDGAECARIFENAP